MVVLGGVGIGLWAHRGGQDAPVRSQQLTIPVVDGPARDQHIDIDATVYYPASTPAPAVLVSPGFGETKTSVDGQAHSMTCTAVTGLTGLEAGPLYSSKTVAVPASGVGTQTWVAVDFGGTGGSVIQGGTNLSVTCTLPPNVALQGFESVGVIDVGE